MEVETAIDESLWPVPRVGHIGVMWRKYMLIWGGYHHGNSGHEEYLSPYDLWIYDTELYQWQMKTVKSPDDKDKCLAFDEDHPGVSAGCAISVQETLYIFGGHTIHGTSEDMYSLQLGSWQSLQWECMDYVGKWPSPRDKCAGWEYDDKLYYFGGFTEPFEDEHLHNTGVYLNDDTTRHYVKGWTNQLLVFDIKTRQWRDPEIEGATICPRAAHSAARLENKVFIFGGRCLGRRLNDLYMLDLTTLIATKIEAGDLYSPCGRSWQIFSHISEQHILLYGGFTSNEKVLADGWILDTGTLEWSQLSHIPEEHPLLWHTGCTTPEDEVLIFGGLRGNILDPQDRDHKKYSNALLKVRISPKSLKRLTMDSMFNCEELLKESWPCLPRHVQVVFQARAKARTPHSTDVKKLKSESSCSAS